MNNIIHIAGPKCSGTTFIYNKLKQYYSNKIIVKDLVDMVLDFFLKN